MPSTAKTGLFAVFAVILLGQHAAGSRFAAVAQDQSEKWGFLKTIADVVSAPFTSVAQTVQQTWPFDGWEQNVAQINANAGRISTNANNIYNNANNINNVAQVASNNAGNILNNANNIHNVAGHVATNAANIRNNANAVQTVGGWAVNNAANINRNQNAINYVAGVAGQNAANIRNNANAIHTVGGWAVKNAAGVSANAQDIRYLGYWNHFQDLKISQMASSLSLLSGSVASNTAAIGELSTQVAVLSEVAAPTLGLASALGVSSGTIATLSLAGSFTAPVLGVLMLVYVCWPDEDNDPWWQIESRVSQMIDDKFNEERRKRLTERLKRYIKEFSRCSTAWVHHATMRGLTDSSSGEGQSLLQHLGSKQESRHQQHASLLRRAIQNMTGEEVEVLEPSTNWTAGALTPPCMEALEMTMSIERDEWMIAHGNSLSGLFMPFANLHTQVQAILTDYPSMTHQVMDWRGAAQATAGEYAHYMLTHMLDAWKSQVCRSVRLRYIPSTTRRYWQYIFAVLKPIWQPHAGESCFEQCGSKSGWCNFCGGRNVGACCKKGAAQQNPPQDPSECLPFDPPIRQMSLKTAFSSTNYHACVHSDCAQQNLYYNGETLHRWKNVTDWEKCQAECLHFERVLRQNHSAHSQIVFTWSPDSKTCKCRSGDLSRVVRKGAVSGPVPCPSKQATDAQSEEAKAQTPKVPMEEIHPANGSPWVQNFEELQEGPNETQWIYESYQNVSKSVVTEYNPFYTRFAKFVDRLAWRAGCGPHPDLSETADYSVISGDSDFGSFGECDWERQKKRGNEAEWVPDEARAEGLFGGSIIDMDAQATLKMKYPLPQWLQSRRGLLACLAKAARGGTSEDGERDSLEGGLLKAIR